MWCKKACQTCWRQRTGRRHSSIQTQNPGGRKHRIISLMAPSPPALEIRHSVYCNSDLKVWRERSTMATWHLQLSKKVLCNCWRQNDSKMNIGFWVEMAFSLNQNERTYTNVFLGIWISTFTKISRYSFKIMPKVTFLRSHHCALSV